MKNLISPVRAECGIAFLLIFAMVQSSFGGDPCARLGDEKEVTHGKPLVVGKPYVVPDLRLRFSDLETGEPVTPNKIRLFYIWWAYMTQDGEWNTNQELFDCDPQGSEFVIPSYEVRPRSWEHYPFSFLPWRKPILLEVEVRVFAGYGYGPRSLIIKRRYLKRFRGKTLHMKIPKLKAPSTLFEYWLEEPDGSVLRVKRTMGGGLSFVSPKEELAQKARWREGAFVPPPTSLESEAGCKRAGEPAEATKGEALVTGRTYVVPELRLRFSDLRTGNGITPKKVGLGYVWKDPVMLLESEDFNCYPGGETFVIPSFKVRPQTWEQYRGSSLPWNKPKFVWFQMTFYDARMKVPALLQIPRHDIEQFRDKTLHVKIPLDQPSTGAAQYWLEAADGSLTRVQHGFNELIFTPVSARRGQSTGERKR